jgi:large subunit ribosomal protein L6
VSRIGLKPIQVPDKVQMTMDGKNIKAKGPLGELSVNVPDGISYTFEDGVINFTRENNLKQNRALHGLARALTNNIVEGVTTGFTKVLKIEGVGYKAEMKGDRLLLSLGFSHTILVIPPQDLSFETPSATIIKVFGIDKQLVGQVAAKIRQLRKPEPYKGKGIRYEGEFVRRKAGKTAGK